MRRRNVVLRLLPGSVRPVGGALADKIGPHIQALAGISRLWQNESFRAAALAAQTADELHAAIESHQA